MMKRSLTRGICLIIALMFVAALGLTGCGQKEAPKAEEPKQEAAAPQKEEPKKEEPKQQEPKKLKLAMFSPEQDTTYKKLNIVDAVKKAKNIDLEIEKFKDSTDFENAMKIRKAANELPDVFGLKPYQLALYKDILLPLDGTDFEQNNLYAKSYAMDGKVLGVPECSFNEFVWYRKSIFQELNLSVPKTWPEFVEVGKKIKASGKYIPLLMGQKDDWTNYPFTEFMPALIANDGALWNKMATQDEPFGKDGPFYQAFAKYKQLIDQNVLDKSLLGAGNDQLKVMFGSKKGAMAAFGAWFYSEIGTQLNGDFSDVGAFLLPVADKAEDPFRTIVMVDGFWATPKDGKNVEAAKEFMSWYFSEEWYLPYMKDRALVSTVKGLKAEIPATVQEALDAQKYEAVVYDAGNDEFVKLQNATKFNFKKMGQDLLAGKDIDKMMDDMNKAWKAARAAK